jgi:O-antigen/teichoic acid export membrane protein
MSPGRDSAKSDDTQHAARSGAVQALTIVVQAVLFLTESVFARLFGPTVYGGYSILKSSMEVCTRGAAAGAPSSMLRYVAAARTQGDEEGVRRALGSGLRLCLIVGGMVGLGLALGLGAYLPNVRSSVAPAMRLMAPIPILVPCLAVLIQATLAARATRANFWVRGVFEPLSILAAGLIAWALNGGLRGLAIAYTSAAAATLLMAVITAGRVFRPAERHRVLAAPATPGFVRFALPLGLGDFLNAVLQRADVLIVAGFYGEDVAAIYYAAENITRVVANIRYAFDSIVAGLMSEMLHVGDLARTRDSLRLVTRWVITGAAPIAGAVIAMRTDLLVAFGKLPVYATGAPALLVLALSHLANASLGLPGWALVSSGRSRLLLLNNALGVAFNISVGIFLTPRFGLVGTASAVLGTVLLVQGLAVIEVWLLLRIHPFSAALWKPLLAAALAFVAEAAVQAVVPILALRIAAVILAGLIVYGGTLMALGLPPEERRLVERLARRREHRK